MVELLVGALVLAVLWAFGQTQQLQGLSQEAEAAADKSWLQGRHIARLEEALQRTAPEYLEWAQEIAKLEMQVAHKNSTRADRTRVIAEFDHPSGAYRKRMYEEPR